MSILKVNTIQKKDGTQFPLIGQVVSVTKTDTFSSTSESWLDITGLSLNITPTSTSSKILLTTQINFGGSQSSYAFARLMRDSTAICIGDTGETNQVRASISLDLPNAASHDIYKLYSSSIEFLDSPSSLSSITYKVQAYVRTASTLYVNRPYNNDTASYIGRLASSITATEVLA